MLTILFFRDSEESAPAEYPPDQPEADTLDDDGTGYGAEEAEMQAALEKELEETEASMTKRASVDREIADVGTKAKEEDEASDDGSEDLEEESSESEDDEEDEEAAEGEDTEMGEGEEKPAATAETNGEQKATESKPEVMVH